MKRIDISEWGEFNISDLFELILPKGDNQAQKLADGKIPLISSGVAENGIVKYIAEGEPNSEIYSGKKLTVDMFGQAFYHNYDFYAVSHGRINILIPKFKNISKNIGSFLASVMTKKFNSKYGFSEMCSQKMLSKEKIKLPARKNEQGKLEPDWPYMETYIKNVQQKANARLDNLQNKIKTHKTAWFLAVFALKLNQATQPK